VAQLYKIDCPNPSFKCIMEERGSAYFTGLFEMRIPANLHATLQSDQPPSFDFFMKTPAAFDLLDSKLLREWYVVYCVAMKHPVTPSEHRLYIGSGSNMNSGGQGRIRKWKNEDLLPEKVIKFMQKGFKIVHVGILLLIKKPSLGYHALGRLWVLTMEARLTFRFWSVYQKERDIQTGHHYAEKLHSWNIDELDWEGLNSRTPLRDPISNMTSDLSEAGIKKLEKELVDMMEKRKKKKAAYLAAYSRSSAGKTTRKKYKDKPESKANAKVLNRTPKAVATRKRYSKTPAGVASTQKSRANWKAKLESKEERAKYNEKLRARRKTPKGKAAVARSNARAKAKRAKLKEAAQENA
jgi:hypothetical protein